MNPLKQVLIKPFKWCNKSSCDGCEYFEEVETATFCHYDWAEDYSDQLKKRYKNKLDKIKNL